MLKNCQNGTPVPKIMTKRNRYFTGKYMTADDFSAEQAYFLNRLWLHNRLHHGWGIVSGLRVLPHPRSDCVHEWVVVRAGIAIDCYGRELILEKDTPIQLPKVVPEGILVIQYQEKEIEYGPILYSEDGCSPTREEANQICEIAELKIIPLTEISKGCWPHLGPAGDSSCRNDCDDPLPGPVGATLNPECACPNGAVPLAWVAFSFEEPDTKEIPGNVEIDMTGRRQLPTAPEFLTHISEISWEHGGGLSVTDLQSVKGRLWIKFDRKLLVLEKKGVGINEFTFSVQYSGAQQSPEYLPGIVTLEGENDLAVFTIDATFLKNNIRRLPEDNFYITLRCDFILDCHGEPVDGDHLYGRLPSGNGTPGGLFESWVKITS